MRKVPLKLRAPSNEDLNFILNSWLKSFRNSSFGSPQCNAVYYKNQQLLIKALLSQNLITVACSEQDDNHIYGYCVFNYLPGDILCIHYLYTKFSFRKMGIARRIVDSIQKVDMPVLYTHHTKFAELLKNKLSIIYDPYKV